MKNILFVGSCKSPMYKQLKQSESDVFKVTRTDSNKPFDILGMCFDGVIFDDWYNSGYFLATVRPNKARKCHENNLEFEVKEKIV